MDKPALTLTVYLVLGQRPATLTIEGQDLARLLKLAAEAQRAAEAERRGNGAPQANGASPKD